MADPFARLEQNDSATRQSRVVDTLRDWAANGELARNEKHSEAALAARLGVSRTPVRHALAILVEEGVLQRAGGRGYVVRTYDASDIAAAIDMRAAIEGLAARKAALEGLSPETEAHLRDCLAEGDDIFAAVGEPIDEQRYARMNARFHELVISAADTPLMQEVRSILDRVPYGEPDAIRFSKMTARDRATHLHQAHLQHHYIVAALVAQDGARVENLFREHGEMVKVSLGLAPGPWQRGSGPDLPIGNGRHGDGKEWV